MHIVDIRNEIVRLQNVKPSTVAGKLIAKYPALRHLVENFALAVDNADPMKATGSLAVASSRGHKQSDGIVAVGDTATHGYAVSTISDRGRLRAVEAAIVKCSDIVERLLTGAEKPKDERPRCGSRSCDGRNVRQPVGVKLCGFCGRDMTTVRKPVVGATAVKKPVAKPVEKKPVRPSEAVALGRRLEEEVARQSAERQKELGRSHGGDPHGKSPQGAKGATRDIVGKAVGMSGSTYQHAKQVVTAAEDEDRQPGQLEADRRGLMSALRTSISDV